MAQSVTEVSLDFVVLSARAVVWVFVVHLETLGRVVRLVSVVPLAFAVRRVPLDPAEPWGRAVPVVQVFAEPRDFVEQQAARVLVEP